eukprot:gnl/MRDRNA2_/MRDRNA2_88067_c0_seq1.p1 gnl/MRDRNA2_/MRDRNA2_88067_c0~~gnl/MRDRNA2_/MRDRNA2_88067_c0_seq1.p1  ORF type:complete len:623 (+),score=166.83 gnl/MRDRNA2_/MRDRNA2_88067_c0_seq1:69-1937(+)
MSLGHGTAKTKGAAAKSPVPFPAALRRSVYYDTPQQKIIALESRCKALEEQIRAVQQRREQQVAEEPLPVDTNTNGARLEELEDRLNELKDNHAHLCIKDKKCLLLLQALTSLHEEVRVRASGLCAAAPREPLHIVESVHNLLKQIFAAHQRREAEVEEEIRSNDIDFKPRLAALSEGLEKVKLELEQETDACTQVQEAFERRQAEIEEVRNDGVNRSDTLLREQTALSAQLERSASEATLLNLWNAESLRHIQDQDEKMEKIPQKMKQAQSVAKRSHLEKENVEQALLNKMRVYEKQLSQKGNREAQRDRLLEELAKLRREAHNLRRDQKHKAAEQLEARLAQHERELARMEEDIVKLETAHHTIGQRLGKKEEDLQQCAKEYGRVQAELQRRIEDRTNAQEQKEEDAGKIVQQHPYVAQVLKRKVMEREEEIHKLQNKLRHIMVVEKKMELQERIFAEERNRYEVELSNWRQKLGRTEDRMSFVLARSPTAQAALAAELQAFCGSDDDKDDQEFEMIEDDNSQSQAFPALYDFDLKNASPAPARSRSPRNWTPGFTDDFDDEEEQKPPPGPKLARPLSAFTGRRLPANQISTCSSALMQVGSLLPQRARPQSAPRRMVSS